VTPDASPASSRRGRSRRKRAKRVRKLAPAALATSEAPRLRRTQRWFLGRVSGRGAGGSAPAESVVLPSATLRPEERMDIYAGMYLARLEECLASDFPVTKALLGGARFSQLVRDYVAAHPPTSWTLNDLGVHLPAFVARRQGLPRAALVRDVVRLERAMSETFDAADAPALTSADIAAVPPEAWATARLVPGPSVRVLAFATQANQAVVSVREKDRVPGRLPPGPSWVVVYRKELRVWRLTLPGPMHAALAALVRGRPLAAAVRAAARADKALGGHAAAPLEERVRRAFAMWVEEGLFTRVELT
jgi:putative DNA-binding protein